VEAGGGGHHVDAHVGGVRRQPRHGRWHALVVVRAGPELPVLADAAGKDAQASLADDERVVW